MDYARMRDKYVSSSKAAEDGTDCMAAHGSRLDTAEQVNTSSTAGTGNTDGLLCLCEVSIPDSGVVVHGVNRM